MINYLLETKQDEKGREGEVEIGRERELKENTERWNNRSKTDVEDNEVRGKKEENDGVGDKK